MEIPYSLGQLFSHICSVNSASVALSYPEKAYTYQELNSRANRLAHFLLSKGLYPGDVVAIIHSKKLDAYALMLACLKTGIAYTNIDGEIPLSRMQAILFQCQPGLFVSDNNLDTDDLPGLAKKLGIPFYSLPQLDLEFFEAKDPEIIHTVSGSRLAYIMFTSGSTGLPKGVAITHQNVLNFIGWVQHRYQISPQDVITNINPMYFDNSVFDFYAALFSGATLVPIEKELLSQPQNLLKRINNASCTIWFSVPSMLIYLNTMRALTAESFRSIRIITFGGEGFPKSELKKIFDLYHHRIRFVNVYGPTEGTCICSSHDITADDFIDMKGLPSLGKINPNFNYLILDETGKPSSQGELSILGPNIALGYYRDPDRTKEVFSTCYDHHFYGTPLYKTGDLVCEIKGQLFFVGRKDNQIKHLGYRIELEEIELSLNAIEGISQAAVIYERVSAAFGKIIAFISGGQKYSYVDIVEKLKTNLPHYMIPNVVIWREQLPKNQNGKIDRKALRHLYQELSGSENYIEK